MSGVTLYRGTLLWAFRVETGKPGDCRTEFDDYVRLETSEHMDSSLPFITSKEVRFSWIKDVQESTAMGVV